MTTVATGRPRRPSDSHREQVVAMGLGDELEDTVRDAERTS